MTQLRLAKPRSLPPTLGIILALGGALLDSTATYAQYKTTNLVTDDQGVNAAQITDMHLKNSWGVSHSSGSPFWASDDGSGLSTLYAVSPQTNGTHKLGLEVVIPGAGTPTGQVFNTANASAFNKDLFLFVSQDGTISGWRGSLGTNAEILQTGSTANVYKGVALDTTGGHSYLLSANFRAGSIDVLKGDAAAPNLAGNFTDPNLPSGYAPFNIALINGRIYVTYAVQNPAKHDDVPAPGNGIVSAFDLNGNLLGRIGSNGTLDSPWGLALAPSGFGKIAGDLLVGNFGDGTINIFSPDPANPAFLGQLLAADLKPLSIDGLWGLIPGNDGAAGNSQYLYFTAGPNRQANGLFGLLTPVPEPGSLVLGLISTGIVAACWKLRNRRSTRVA
jgi:uncharacterized protein (TIGR03118 family)